jgi:hypothetical protein
LTILTVPTLLLIVVGLLRQRLFGIALAVSGITGAGAAAVIGVVAVPTFYAVAFGGVVLLASMLLRPSDAPRIVPPAVPLLLVFAVWSLIVTIVSPFLFAGLATVTPQHAILAAGVVTSSNVAQFVYLVLGIAVVTYIALHPDRGVGLLGIVCGGGVLLSYWRYLHTAYALPFPDGVFDNTPFVDYIETAPGGFARFRGIYSEPSALGAVCLAMITYAISRARQLRGWKLTGLISTSLIALFLGVQSTSTTFIVAGVAIGAIWLMALVFGFVARHTTVSRFAGVGVCLVVLAALWFLPIAAAFVSDAVSEKVTGSSYGDRSNSDVQSYEIFFHTWGLGVGLGAGRASSFAATLLSTVGLVGALLFTAAIIQLLRGAGRSREFRPALWVLVATLVAKLVAGAQLSDPTGVLWIAMGLLSAAILRTRLPRTEQTGARFIV